MTDGAWHAGTASKRWLLACLALLLAVVVYNDMLDPIIKTFGLAHAKLMDGPSSRILVVDNLASADAPSVQAVFDGEIWGMHAFRVHQILIPFLVLALSVGGLCHLLASRSARAGSYFFQLRRGSALPPVGLWAALFLGGCFAAWSEEGLRLHPSFALIPFVLSLLVAAGVSAGPRPNSTSMARAFNAMAASRWFWLGYLTLSPSGLFREDLVLDGAAPLGISWGALLACAGSLLVLHWACRPPRAVELGRFSGSRQVLLAEYERLSLLCLQELWLILPAVLMAAVVSSLRIVHLAPFLLLSASNALLMKWSLEKRPSPSDSAGDKAGRALTRLATGLLMVGLPFAAELRPLFAGVPVPLVSWLVLIGLGLVKGRPWMASQAALPVVDLTVTPVGPAPRVSWGTAVLGLATLAVISVALRGGLPLPASDPTLAAAQSDLASSFGHQARLVRLDGEALLVGCNLDVARLSLAAEIVSAHLPDDQTKVVSVRTRRWERAGTFFLAITVAVFLVFPAYLLTFAAPGRCPAPYFALCGLLGGANGAFAVGSALGWFWMDPMPYLAAFLLCTSLSWLGIGYARAWIDGRVSALGGATGLVPVARNSAG
jgi:hypothetical protein